MLRCDLVLVPCKAYMLEARALTYATQALRQAQVVREGKPPGKIILSMVGKNYRLAKDMREAAATLDLPMAETAMILRQIYADAPGKGATVWDLGARGKEAVEEVEQLMRELLPEAVNGSLGFARRSQPLNKQGRNNYGGSSQSQRWTITTSYQRGIGFYQGGETRRNSSC